MEKDKVLISMSKWAVLMWHVRFSLLVLIMIALSAGYFSAPSMDRSEIDCSVEVENPVSKYLDGIELKIDQSKCCLNLEKNTMIVRTNVAAYGPHMPKYGEVQESFIMEVATANVEEEEKRQTTKAEEYIENLKIKLGIN